MGTRLFARLAQTAGGDHPHAYGDKIPVLVTVAFSLGSSPRVWGQEVKRAGFNNAFRIIPTRMGTRAKTSTFRLALKDHPHAYGDKF